jgi:hypothetical protein
MVAFCLSINTTSSEAGVVFGSTTSPDRAALNPGDADALETNAGDASVPSMVSKEVVVDARSAPLDATM